MTPNKVIPHVPVTLGMKIDYAKLQHSTAGEVKTDQPTHRTVFQLDLFRDVITSFHPLKFLE
jgi:hypothetical protein